MNEVLERLVRRAVVFRQEQVLELLGAAGRATGEVQLVKDDGAYLAAWTHEDLPAMTVYGIGHQSPDDFSKTGVDGPLDSPWMAQRYQIEQTFGGDDFALDVDVTALRAAATLGDVIFVTEVRMTPWPEGVGDVMGRREDIPRLERVLGPHAI